MSCVFLTNQQEKLAEKLRKKLFSHKNNFLRKLVIVPCDAAKKAIIEYLMESQGVATGIRFLNLNMAMQYLLEVATSKSYRFVKSALLPLYLEEVLSGVHDHDLTLYLEGKQGRLRALARKLAKDFLDDGLYGVQDKEGWQKIVWDRYCSDWDRPQDAFRSTLSPQIRMEVHLFGFTHIPEVYRHFLNELSNHLPITHYMLSPSQQFWGDLLSENRRYSLCRYHEKRGVSQSEIEGLTEYLSEPPPLLSNNVAYGTELLGHYIDEPFDLHEEYEVNGSSMLHTVQRDLLNMETSEVASDGSIQLHNAPSKRREVGALLSTLVDLYAKAPFSADDVAILCADTTSYLPFVEMVFGSSDSPFGFVIEGGARTAGSRYLQMVHDWTTLMGSRFEPKWVMRLLRTDDPARVWQFIEKTNIRWGFDRTHKEKVLSAPSDDDGTWKQGFEQLMLSLAMESGTGDSTFFPTQTLDFSDGQLLEEVMEQVQWHYSTSQELLESRQAGEWALYLLTLFDELLPGELDEGLSAHIQALGQLSSTLPFDSVRTYLLDYLESPAHTVRSTDMRPRIKFQQPQEGSAVAKKIVCLMGMDEESFPRIAFNEHPKAPSCTDADRFLFLQMMHSAREHLIITYTSKLPDGTECGPSPLLDPLLSYPIQHITHKGLPFHASYFDKSAPVRERSELNSALAQCYYGSRDKRAAAHPFTPSSDTLDPLTTLEVRELKAFASHPIRYYFNRTLGLYLENDSDESQKEFFLTPLDRAIYQNAQLQGKDAALSTEASGLLPQGQFKAVAQRELDSLPSVETRSEEILLHVGDVEITGPLDGIADHGFVHRGSSKIGDVIKVWPLFLLHLILYPDVNTLISLKDDTTTTYNIDARAELAKYLDYFNESRSLASPLLPTWAETLLKKDAAAFEKQVAQTISGEQAIFTDPYVNWAFKHAIPDFHQTQVERFKNIFAQLL